MEMHAHLTRAAKFGCGFSRDAIRAWVVNKVSINREKEEMKKTINHRRGALSVIGAIELLAKPQVRLEDKMLAA